MSSPRPTVNAEDAHRADDVLRLWSAGQGMHVPTALATGPVLELRGILMAAFAECRADAYADALLDYRAASTDPEPAL